eukprot:CAMPEP_0185831308 /NCGR_PEP_ID=MMETSP1353-20130828/1412_1 /TAXON_ID=1077150 /ORGANISM="Erythrolobus australicus, Strain CCMP3124" /LENGTH=293 /DNA_ID=CAMNT_0028529357 /DNA_START=89 /DNA_END=970 /DNA_ORIENTATION=+
MPTFAGGDTVYSMPDQKARHANHVETDNERAMHIDKLFKKEDFKGKRVLVTGANRGLGLQLATLLVDCGAEVVATCRKVSPELEKLGVAQIIDDADVSSDEKMEAMAKSVKGDALDVVINNAGFMMKDKETIFKNPEDPSSSKPGYLDFSKEVKTIDICAVGMIRATAALAHAGKLKEGSKVILITSQSGSVAWRDVQSLTGGDYGHHMSKAAANMAGKLMAHELKSRGIIVSLFHPGFNRTEMTAKMSDVWDEEGAVEPEIGARRVLYQISLLDLKSSGKFFNCEDGLEIPW